MGEELTRKLVMISKDGEQREFKNARITSVTVEPHVIAEDDTLCDYCKTRVEDCNYEFNVEIENITRKRFIKLLMARGMARNGAKDIAKYIHKKYGYYNQTFLLFL